MKIDHQESRIANCGFPLLLGDKVLKRRLLSYILADGRNRTGDLLPFNRRSIHVVAFGIRPNKSWSGHPDSNRSLADLQSAALAAWLCARFGEGTTGLEPAMNSSKDCLPDRFAFIPEKEIGTRGRIRTFIDLFLTQVPRPIWATRA